MADDPLAGSSWSRPETVAGFTQSPPNATLVRCAADELRRIGHGRLIDIGCGAARNAAPLADLGWDVLGTDLSWPMLGAATARGEKARVAGRLRVALAPLDALPVRSGCADFVVAHGIWNLARSGAEFRRGMAEAARVAKPGAPLFVFTFSRLTLAADAQPVTGETFVFTQFSGEPQCFVTAKQLTSELDAAGFVPDATIPWHELNRPGPGALPTGAPVIYECAFRRR